MERCLGSWRHRQTSPELLAPSQNLVHLQEKKARKRPLHSAQKNRYKRKNRASVLLFLKTLKSEHLTLYITMSVVYNSPISKRRKSIQTPSSPHASSPRKTARSPNVRAISLVSYVTSNSNTFVAIVRSLHSKSELNEF